MFFFHEKSLSGSFVEKNGCTKQFLAVDANCLYDGRWVIGPVSQSPVFVGSLTNETPLPVIRFHTRSWRCFSCASVPMNWNIGERSLGRCWAPQSFSTYQLFANKRMNKPLFAVSILTLHIYNFMQLNDNHYYCNNGPREFYEV